VLGTAGPRAPPHFAALVRENRQPTPPTRWGPQQQAEVQSSGPCSSPTRCPRQRDAENHQGVQRPSAARIPQDPEQLLATDAKKNVPRRRAANDPPSRLLGAGGAGKVRSPDGFAKIRKKTKDAESSDAPRQQARRMSSLIAGEEEEVNGGQQATISHNGLTSSAAAEHVSQHKHPGGQSGVTGPPPPAKGKKTISSKHFFSSPPARYLLCFSPTTGRLYNG